MKILSLYGFLMKIIGSTLLLGGILATSAYVYENNKESVVGNQNSAIQTLNQDKISMILSNDIGISPGRKKENLFLSILENDVELRMRIQGMSWYGDCINGKLALSDCLDNITYVLEIENLINQNPDILNKMQYESWWQKYLSGFINPENLLLIHIPSSEQIEKFKTENTETYSNVVKNPIWTNLQDSFDNGDNLEAYQSRYLSAINDINSAIKENPNIESSFQRYDLKMDDFYKKSTVDEINAAYSKMNAIIILENANIQDNGKYNSFLQTDIGKQYLSGEIDVNKALQFFESL